MQSNLKASYASTLSKSKKGQPAPPAPIQPKNTVMRWFKRLLCIKHSPGTPPEYISHSPGKLEISSIDSSFNQPTFKVFKGLCCDIDDLKKYFRENFMVFSSRTITEPLGYFLAQLNILGPQTEAEIYASAIPTDPADTVLLLTQSPNIKVIKMLQKRASQLMIVMPNKLNSESLFSYVNALRKQQEPPFGSDQFTNKEDPPRSEKLLCAEILQNSKVSQDEVIPEVLFGKVLVTLMRQPSFRSLSMIGQVVVMADANEEGRLYLLETTKMLLKYTPRILQKLTILMPPQTRFEDILQLGSMISNDFYTKYESEEWQSRIRHTSDDHSFVQLQLKDKKSNLFGSQYVNLTKESSKQNQYNLCNENFELMTKFTRYALHGQDQTYLIGLQMKFGMKQQNRELEISQTQLHPISSHLCNFFVKKIFFTDDLPKQSQYDKGDQEQLLQIIQGSSFLSCCASVYLLMEKSIGELSALTDEQKYKTYIQILTGTGMLYQSHQSQTVQQIFKKYISKIQIYESYLPKTMLQEKNLISSQQQQQPQIIINPYDEKYSFDFALSELGEDQLGASEMQNQDWVFKQRTSKYQGGSFQLFNHSKEVQKLNY